MSTTVTEKLAVSARPAYKLEELLALRSSISESTVSLDRFGDEEAIKVGTVLQPTSVTPEKPLDPNLLRPPMREKKNSPTPSIKRGKAERLLKEHGSPPGLRVTAGGRIVPATFTPLASPFQYQQKGFRLANFTDNRSAHQDANYSAALQMNQGESSNQSQPNELFTLYNNVQSTNLGMPVFNPMNSYENMWSGFNYYIPGSTQYSNQFTTPFAYMVPFTHAVHPTVVGPHSRAQFPTFNTSEASTSDSPVSVVLVDQQIANLETEHIKLNQEKLEFEREEIRRSATLSAADKQKHTEQKRLYVIRLDHLRKSIKELRTVKEKGFSYCDPLALIGVPSPKSSKNSQFNVDGALPQGFHTEILITSQTDITTADDKMVSSPRRRRSHAIEIKVPQGSSQLEKPKSSLNPESPSYQPSKLVIDKSERESTVPKTPSPSETEVTSCTTTVNQTKQTSSGQQTDCSSSESSVNTADFFPNNAAQHSLTRRDMIGLQPSVELLHGHPVSDVAVPRNHLPKTKHELAKEPMEFFVGMYDGLLGLGIRKDMTGNPMYLAGRRESNYYERLEPHNIETNRHLFEIAQGGIPQLKREKLMNRPPYFCLGFSHSLFDIQRGVQIGNSAYFQFPQYVKGWARGLQYKYRLPNSHGMSTTEDSGTRLQISETIRHHPYGLPFNESSIPYQQSSEIAARSVPYSKYTSRVLSTSAFTGQEKSIATQNSFKLSESAPSMSMFEVRNRNALDLNGTTMKPTLVPETAHIIKRSDEVLITEENSVPLTQVPGNASGFQRGQIQLQNHGGDASASPRLAPVSDQTFISPLSISPQHAENPTSQGSSPMNESPKRSPSKQIRNLARAIRSSVATDRSVASTSIPTSSEKKHAGFRDKIQRLCSS